jgi:hypothetical protein
LKVNRVLRLFSILIVIASPIVAKSSDGYKGSHSAVGLSWSAYQGKMNWEKAVSTCSEKGLRLPTTAELSRLYDSDASWMNKVCKEGCVYWSSNIRNSDESYVLSAWDGLLTYYEKEREYDVRCVK